MSTFNELYDAYDELVAKICGAPILVQENDNPVRPLEYSYSAQPVGHELFEPGHEPMYLSAYGEAFSVEDFAQLMRTSNKYPRIKYDSYCVKGLPE